MRLSIFDPGINIDHRTMQTTVGVFGGESYTGGGGAPPLMVENAGQSVLRDRNGAEMLVVLRYAQRAIYTRGDPKP